MNKNYRIKCLRRKLSKPFIKNIPSKKRFFVFVKFLILQIEGSLLVFEKLLPKKSPENQEQVKDQERMWMRLYLVEAKPKVIQELEL